MQPTLPNYLHYFCKQENHHHTWKLRERALHRPDQRRTYRLWPVKYHSKWGRTPKWYIGTKVRNMLPRRHQHTVYGKPVMGKQNFLENTGKYKISTHLRCNLHGSFIVYKMRRNEALITHSGNAKLLTMQLFFSFNWPDHWQQMNQCETFSTPDPQWGQFGVKCLMI